MAIIFKTEERRIIPRLRSFYLSAITGELSLSSSDVYPLNFDRRLLLGEQKVAWNKNKTLTHAGDLLSSAFVLGFENDYREVADFILSHGRNDNTIYRIAKRIIKDSTVHEDLTFDVDLGESKIHADIKLLKRQLVDEPRNPIAWMELGRLYSILNQIKKADKAIENALHLDKNNRFIVRSASRYFHHFSGEKDRPLHVIRNAEFAKSDPWLISADIAYSTILGRHSRVSKVGIEIIKNDNLNEKSTTELKSALGTLEYNHGKLKDARKYLNQSLTGANDNSLAQAAWMSESINGINIEKNKFDIPLAYEANSLHLYELSRYKEAYEQAVRWHNDEPYSTRPIKVASYIASVFLKEHRISISLTEKALQITPGDIMLLNNLVYFMVQNGDIEEAENIFVHTLIDIINEPEKYTDRERTICTATAGLIAFRNNRVESGIKYYEKAIFYAKQYKNGYLIALAMVNYVKEAIMVIKSPEKISALINQLKETCKNNTEPDVLQLYNEIMMTYEAKLIGANINAK